ncbi:hypothetical protein HYZ97_00065 [Candidatus Pacearchaeota archaeon]|nr:hypothetical protein [Candidatus Pacearchaeota archaeon]
MRKQGDYVGELADYIKKNLKKGYTKDSLKFALVNQGHSRLEVEKALKRAEENLVRDAPVLKTKPDITYEVVEPSDAEVKQKPWWKRWFGF